LKHAGETDRVDDDPLFWFRHDAIPFDWRARRPDGPTPDTRQPGEERTRGFQRSNATRRTPAETRMLPISSASTNLSREDQRTAGATTPRRVLPGVCGG